MKHSLPVTQLFRERAASGGRIDTNGDLHRLKSFKGSISNEDRRLLGVIEETIREGRFATPIPQQLSEELGRPRKRVENILTMLESWGRVVKLDENVWLHLDSVLDARNRLVEYCQEHGEIPSNKMKDLIKATRKYVIPLLEHFDRVGLTVRKDSARSLKDGWENVLVQEGEEASAARGDEGQAGTT